MQIQLISKLYRRCTVLLFISTLGTLTLGLFIFISISVTAANRKQCTASLVETIPADMSYVEPITTSNTYTQLLRLINSAQVSIDIASYYWTLQGKDVMPDPVPEASKGNDILKALLNAARLRSVAIRIAVNDDAASANNSDLTALSTVAEIRRLNFAALLHGSGILHTKFLLVDNASFYIGSANFDWRALTHVKELGVSAFNCPTLAEDLANLFSVYWLVGEEAATVPDIWPSELEVQYNRTNPHEVKINSDNDSYQVFFSSSPPDLCPPGRTDELEAVLSLIDSATEYISIAVMDYYPMFLFTYPNQYWPLIDNALRRAVIERRVAVRLMASEWTSTRPSLGLFLKSLAALGSGETFKGSIETKLFVVPPLNATQPTIPHSRVNHNKYMVTEEMVLISTNNWSADYFVSTGGVSIVMNASRIENFRNTTNLHSQLKAVFERDWQSPYARYV